MYPSTFEDEICVMCQATICLIVMVLYVTCSTCKNKYCDEIAPFQIRIIMLLPCVYHVCHIMIQIALCESMVCFTGHHFTLNFFQYG